MTATTTASALDVQIPAAFADLFQPARYKVYYGGRGGAKSRTFARALVMLGYQKKLRILCTRELQVSIEDSVHRLLADTIAELGLDGFYNVTKSNIVGLNGTIFLFKGLRYNVEEIKSTEGINICWVAEANRVSNNSWDVLIPTIREDNSEIWLDFNVDSPDDPAYKRFVLNRPPDSIVRKVGWEDNPWFPAVLRKEMEWDLTHDPGKYLHVWGGEPQVVTEAQIFHGKYSIREFETPPDATFYCGADWGFSNDPDVVIRDFIKDGCLFIDREAYGIGVEINETPKLFDAVLPSKEWPCRADSARPELISHMNRLGYRIIPVKKGPGSIEDGIRFLRSFIEIVIHPRCKHCADEFKRYAYKVDRLTGDVLPIIVDAFNHCIDSIRYSTEPLHAKHGRWIAV